MKHKIIRKILFFAVFSILVTSGTCLGQENTTIFDGWHKFVKEKNNPSITEAVNILEYRMPQLLYSSDLRRIARIAIIPENKAGTSKKNRKLPAIGIIRGQKRVLEALRLDAFLSDDKVCNAFRYLSRLPMEDLSQMDQISNKADSILKEAKEKNKEKIIEGLIKNAKKQALNVPVNPAFNYEIYRFFLLQCWSNQKLLTRALKMYKEATKVEITEITSEIVQKLGRQGYLNFYLLDLPYGPDSYSHYKISAKGDVYCTHHGFVVPPKGCNSDSTIRDQLKAYGITDEKLLDECSDLPPIPNN